MLVNLGVDFAGILIFLFIFWKRLKEDYASEIIFKSAFGILAGIAIGVALSFRFFPTGFLWVAFLGSLIGLGFSVSRFRVRLYETLEAVVVSGLPWVSFIFLKDSVEQSSLSSFIAFLALLVIIFIYYFFDQHYKEFAWYKSGKIGFAGLATLGIIFLTRSLLAIMKVPVVSFLGGYEAITSGVVAFICFLLIFNLGRTKE